MRVLITSGGTSEYIDGVRVMTNLSSGSTGRCIAKSFIEAGHEVHMLFGRFASYPEGVATAIRYSDFKDLEDKLTYGLNHHIFDVVIHLAAVSDFSPEAIIYEDGRSEIPSYKGKISSSETFMIRFKKNHKIIDRIKSFSATDLILIGFKLTNTEATDERKAAVDGLLSRGLCDLVVHNDLHGINGEKHEAAYYSDRGCLGTSKTKEEMAAWLLDYLGDIT